MSLSKKDMKLSLNDEFLICTWCTFCSYYMYVRWEGVYVGVAFWSNGVIVILMIESWRGANQDSYVILDYIHYK